MSINELRDGVAQSTDVRTLLHRLDIYMLLVSGSDFCSDVRLRSRTLTLTVHAYERTICVGHVRNQSEAGTGRRLP
jgi:hypothetical protein